MKSVRFEITTKERKYTTLLLLRSDDSQKKLSQQNKMCDNYSMWHGKGKQRREGDTKHPLYVFATIVCILDQDQVSGERSTPVLQQPTLN